MFFFLFLEKRWSQREGILSPRHPGPFWFLLGPFGDPGVPGLWTQVLHRHTSVGYCWRDNSCLHGASVKSPVPPWWVWGVGQDLPEQELGTKWPQGVLCPALHSPLLLTLKLIFLFLQTEADNNHSYLLHFADGEVEGHRASSDRATPGARSCTSAKPIDVSLWH